MSIANIALFDQKWSDLNYNMDTDQATGALTEHILGGINKEEIEECIENTLQTFFVSYINPHIIEQLVDLVIQQSYQDYTITHRYRIQCLVCLYHKLSILHL